MRRFLPVILLLVALAFPPVMQVLDQEYYVSFGTRLLILALAASSLNFILGYGGMVSFGHAAFFGTGAYTTALLAQQGMRDFALVALAAVLAAALLATLYGLIALRTRGVYFIMITLALAQMLFYIVVSTSTLGGEDGLSVRRSVLWNDTNLADDRVMYYTALIATALSLFVLWRTVNARFGTVVRAARDNETRTEALGYPVYRYQLTTFVLGGAFAGLAGMLMANLAGFANPGMLSWPQSGQFMMMVILGGVGTFWSGLIGAGVLIILEEWLGELTQHWPLILGLALVGIMLFAPRGLAGLRFPTGRRA